jgi:hypothetical protein
MVNMKICRRCDISKPFSNFYKATASKDGCSSRCKSCELEYQRGRKSQKQVSNSKWQSSEKYDRYKEKLRLQTKKHNMHRISEKLDAFTKVTGDAILTWRKNATLRHAAKIQATPHWLTRNQRSRIMQVYALTQQLQEVLGAVFHVDHIVPLVSKNVCGLHVWWNLQPLSEVENIKKGNTFNPAIYPAQGEIAFPDGDGPKADRISAHMEQSDD